jgi:RNA polymerase sigma-70 factor, ECF subfamily
MTALRQHNEVTFGAEDRGFVFAVARRIVGSAEDAEDVTQDALLLAYRHRAAFRGDARYRTWLYRIASTTALGHLRRRRRSRELLAPTEDALAAQLPDDAKSPEASVADAEAARVLTSALTQLDPKYRDVMLSRVDATETETAARLGITVANVKIRAHRARKQLRDVLAPLR